MRTPEQMMTIAKTSTMDHLLKRVSHLSAAARVAPVIGTNQATIMMTFLR
jgi:hypothetical protein